MQTGRVQGERGLWWCYLPVSSLWSSTNPEGWAGCTPMILSAVLTVRCSPSSIWFAGWPKPYSYRRAQNRLNNSRVKLCHVRLWQVELFQLTKKVHSLLGLFTMESMWVSHFRSWEMVVPRNLNGLHCIHRVVHDSEWGESWGVSPEVHDHLHSFKRCWAPGCLDSTRQPAP